MSKNTLPTPKELELEVQVGYKSLGLIFKNAPDGERAFQYLEDLFGGVTIGYDLNGSIDPYGTMVKNGHREILDHIKGAIEDANQ